MVNKRFWLGILAIALVFGMTVVGCGGDPKIEYVDKIVEVPIEIPIAGMATQDVAPQATLAETLDWVKSNYEDFTNYIIDLKDYDEVSYIAPATLDYPDIRAITVTLTNTGTDERTITLKKTGSGGSAYQYGDTGSLFTINAGVYLVIDGKLNLKGIDAAADGRDNDAPLIDVAAGAGLVMKGQSKIIGNTNSFYGGGVYVERYGTFIMEGGEITGNKITESYGYNGGGVYVSGTFFMTGGSISNNTAAGTSTSTTLAGGVYVDGTFTMMGGSINGNTVTGGGTAITGICVYGEIKLSGSPQITDTVGLYYSAITLNGVFTPAAAVPVDLLCYDADDYNSGSPTVWNNETVLEWGAAYTGHPASFPVDKFALGKWLERNTGNNASITGKHIDSANGQLVDN